jgi:hypothetical protein
VRLGGRRNQLSGPSCRMLQAAGIDRRTVGDIAELSICREVAYRVTHRGNDRLEAVLAAAEELLSEEANYDFVVAFLEDVQNLVSHRIKTLCSAGEITARLGPQCAACWSALADFWASVAEWCSQAGIALKSSEKIVSVQNDQLRQLVWTASRTLPDGSMLGLAEAVLYEKAGGAPIPGYGHIAAAMMIAGQG